MGLPEDFSFYLVSIANAASGFGRLVAGLMADGVGKDPDYVVRLG